ncbi:hypothetical protein SDC9_43204 [bioreactor metagenome]|uniref:Uncharacterized protein n=1 Tax=bioreactor metagenome TaxID=1076179 RepID=A0A644W0A9_9ZZZZ
MLFQNGHDILQPLFVADLVIEAEFNIGEERRRDSLWIVCTEHRLSIFQAVITSDRTVALLFLVEIVEQGKRGVVLIAVHQKQGSKTGKKLIEGCLARI